MSVHDQINGSILEISMRKKLRWIDKAKVSFAQPGLEFLSGVCLRRPIEMASTGGYHLLHVNDLKEIRRLLLGENQYNMGHVDHR